LPPIVIPIPIQGPQIVEQQPLQVTEYVQDIYPPAQVYSDQVPVVCLLIVFFKRLIQYFIYIFFSRVMLPVTQFFNNLVNFKINNHSITNQV